MKLVAFLLVLCVAVSRANLLPPGFQSAEELANVLANEPAAASRFAEASAADTISFRDTQTPTTGMISAPTDGSLSSAPAGGCGCQNTPTVTSFGGGGGCDCSYDGIDDDTSEFDAQLEQIERDIRNLRMAIKETEECAKRLREQEAEIRALKEQRDHLEKEKEKKILQAKLERQMRDLSEINRMSRSLRTKFNELKHTQKLIRTKMIGTRSSLNQLDSEPEIDMETLDGGADMLGKQLDAMHKSQIAMLSAAHARNEQKVKNEIETANRAHDMSVKAGDNGESFLS